MADETKKKYVAVCRSCKSDVIFRYAELQWDVDTQQWVPFLADDKYRCVPCGIDYPSVLMQEAKP